MMERTLAGGWKDFLARENVPYLQTDTWMHLPNFWLTDAHRWLHLVSELTPDTLAWFRGICTITRTDGFLAVGLPGQGDFYVEIAAVHARAKDRRRIAAHLHGEVRK
jgi:hypothetical protein